MLKTEWGFSVTSQNVIYLANACPTVPEFLELYFGGPVTEGEACRLWIKAGAEKEQGRRIDEWVAIRNSLKPDVADGFPGFAQILVAGANPVLSP
jgi:hypothetical protein